MRVVRSSDMDVDIPLPCAPEGSVAEPARLFAQPPALWRFQYPATVLWHWLYSNVHDGYQAYKVLEFMLSRRITAGLLPEEHPWLTGVSPLTARVVWPENIVFASPRKRQWEGHPPDPDDIIVSKIGRFLAAMLKRSAISPEI